MRKALLLEIFLLLLLCVTFVILWILPIYVIGFSAELPPLQLSRNVAETGKYSISDDIGRFISQEYVKENGLISAQDGRSSARIIAFLSNWIDWNNTVGWTLVAAITIAATLLLWWCVIVKLFDNRTAWISTVIFGCMPIYWQEAITLSNFTFALFFFIAALAAYVWLFRVSLFLAVIVSGILFGLSLSSKDVFMLFLPWMTILYIWTGRKEWLRTSLVFSIFLLFAFVMYLLPYRSDISELGYPMNHNLARLWPGAGEIANETYLHLYPDPYTYYFDRTRFDQEIVEEVAQRESIERLQAQKSLLSYGVSYTSFFAKIGNSIWLLIHDIPAFFHLETVGGFFFWIFMIPGVIFVFKTKRQYFFFYMGLVAVTYFELRFVLHYNRNHIMDIAWGLSLIAAIGIIWISDLLSLYWKKFSATTISVFFTLFFCLNLMQLNRIFVARQLDRSIVMQTLAQSESVSKIPPKSVLALPLHPLLASQISYVSGRTTALFRENTVRRLLDENKLDQAFSLYGITHILGYSDELSKEIKNNLPYVSIMEFPTFQKKKYSPWVKYLLQVIR